MMVKISVHTIWPCSNEVHLQLQGCDLQRSLGKSEKCINYYSPLLEAIACQFRIQCRELCKLTHICLHFDNLQPFFCMNHPNTLNWVNITEHTRCLGFHVALWNLHLLISAAEKDMIWTAGYNYLTKVVCILLYASKKLKAKYQNIAFLYYYYQHTIVGWILELWLYSLCPRK